MCYSGPVEVPDGTTAIPQYHTFQAPPEQEGFHAVMREGWVLEPGPTPPEPAPYVPSPEDILQLERERMVVSPFQGRVALSDANLLSSVDAAVAAADSKTQIAWEYATEWRRNSPMIVTLAGALNLSDTQVDDLFRAAAQVTA